MDPIARVNGASSFQTISGRKQLALTAKVCGPSSALRRSSHTEGTKVQKPSSGQSVLSKGPQVPAVTGDARFGAANLGAWQRAPDVQGGRACAPARSWTPRSLLRPARPRTKGGKRDPDMHRTRKCNQWDSGMKAHIGVADESGLLHHVECMAANVACVIRCTSCCTQRKTTVCGDTEAAPARTSARSCRTLMPRLPGCRKAFEGAGHEERTRAPLRGGWEHHKASVRAKGGTSVPNDQAAVRLRQDTLPRLGQGG